jgi:RNA polymerase sigma-70 factor (ECF subfamily)
LCIIAAGRPDVPTRGENSAEKIVTDHGVLPNEGSAASSSLLIRVQRMEPAAWEQLVRLYSPLIYTWCRRANLQQADAEDVGQQVFLSVARAIRSFRRDRPGDSFQGWLRTIARSKIADFHRRRGRSTVAEGGSDGQRRLLDAPDPVQPDDEPDSLRRDKKLLARRALMLIQSEFEDKTWRAYLMTVQDEKSPAEAAAALGTTVNAVYLARVRVQRRLREQFAEVLDP